MLTVTPAQAGYLRLPHQLCRGFAASVPEQGNPSPDPTWVERYLPASVVPYAHLIRLDKPIGLT